MCYDYACGGQASETFDATHCDHSNYVKNGDIVIGPATKVTDDVVQVGKSTVVPYDYLVVATGTRYGSDIKPLQVRDSITIIMHDGPHNTVLLSTPSSRTLPLLGTPLTSTTQPTL